MKCKVKKCNNTVSYSENGYFYKCAEERRRIKQMNLEFELKEEKNKDDNL